MKAIPVFTMLLTVSVAASAQSTQLPQPSDMKTLGLIGGNFLAFHRRILQLYQ
jgi:hypothetical protein